VPPVERVALVTGASGSVGRVAAADLAAAGMRVGLVGTDEPRLDALVDELGLDRRRTAIAGGDLRNEAAARTAVRSIASALGPVDIVVHLVGGWTGGASVADVDPAQFRAMLDQHLWTSVHVARAVLPGMVERGWGRLVAISTPNASTPPARMAPYAVGKAAQETLFAALAREVAGTGVTANVLLARSIRPPGAAPDPAKKDPGTAAEDVASAIAWLCSDAAAAVNGARIPLYGA
jgi:NAD(P)-dependent dehydrogenase (short-subunit alcohol dehydrogenase family)